MPCLNSERTYSHPARLAPVAWQPRQGGRDDPIVNVNGDVRNLSTVGCVAISSGLRITILTYPRVNGSIVPFSPQLISPVIAVNSPGGILARE